MIPSLLALALAAMVHPAAAADSAARLDALEAEVAQLKQAQDPLGLKVGFNAVGVYQNLVGQGEGTPEAKNGNRGAATGGANLILSARPADATEMWVYYGLGSGPGVDAYGPCVTQQGAFNPTYRTDGANAGLRVAYLTQGLFGGAVSATAGVIDPTFFFDMNAAANNENNQFLTACFVNNPILQPGPNAAGAVLEAALGPLKARGGVESANADGKSSLDNLYSIVELEAGWGGDARPGALRVWGRSLPRGAFDETPLAVGASADQAMGPVTLFGRWGKERYTPQGNVQCMQDADGNVLEYGEDGISPALHKSWVAANTYDYAVSAGAVYRGLASPGEGLNDALGAAWGLNRLQNGASEQFAEAYYLWPFSAHLRASLHCQAAFSRMAVMDGAHCEDHLNAGAQQNLYVLGSRVTVEY